MGDINFEQYCASNKEAWDRFSDANPSAWIDSSSAWLEFFEKKFGYKNYSFLIYEDKNLIGIMPLFLVKSVLFGRRIISGPITDGGGPFISKNDEKIIEKISQHIDLIAKESGAKYSELRCSPTRLPGYVAKNEYTNFYIDLNEKSEHIWKNLDKKLRNGIRKAQKTLIVEKHETLDILDKFYNLHLITMKSLGSPPLGYDFYKQTFADLGKTGFVLAAKYEGKIICMVLVITRAETARHESTVYLPSYRNLQANSLLIFSAIEESKKRGCKKFLFGRTLIDGTVYQYKKRWNSKEFPSPFYYKLFKSAGTPSDIRKNPLIPVINFAWRIMPTWITRFFGNYFRKTLAL